MLGPPPTHVSIHAPVWGATDALGCFATARQFQSTPPCGGRQALSILESEKSQFQSTPPCGGRLDGLRDRLNLTEFQSTPPCGGRLDTESGTPSDDLFQSTPPCGGRHLKGVILCGYARVSIHAPVWGATRGGGGGGGGYAVSIHAPVWGATKEAMACCA